VCCSFDIDADSPLDDDDEFNHRLPSFSWPTHDNVPPAAKYATIDNDDDDDDGDEHADHTQQHDNNDDAIKREFSVSDDIWEAQPFNAQLPPSAQQDITMTDADPDDDVDKEYNEFNYWKTPYDI